MVLVYFNVASAYTNIDTGPYRWSVDLGDACSDFNVQGPVQEERLDGNEVTVYLITFEPCKVMMSFTKVDGAYRDPATPLDPADIIKDLIEFGADKDTIRTYEREINGNPGLVASGYIPKVGMTQYVAVFQVPYSTNGHIAVLGDESKMTTALKTINVREIIDPMSVFPISRPLSI